MLRLNPFVFRAYYCATWARTAFCTRSLNPFVFRAYYCGADIINFPPHQRLNPFVFRAYYCVRWKAEFARIRRLNPFVFRAYYCGNAMSNPTLSRVSIPLFSGRITAETMMKNEPCSASLNPFVFRAYYCGIQTELMLHGALVSIPLFSGRITATWTETKNWRRFGLNPFIFRAYYCERASSNTRRKSGLNPFVFRAYYCGDHDENANHLHVSIPLFSGRITAVNGLDEYDEYEFVSIPLFSGRITAPIHQRTWRPRWRLNPFVFRAYYCGATEAEFYGLDPSQSLCFQGVLLRKVPPPFLYGGIVSIPLFSGRITAGLPPARMECAATSQSLCFQGVLLRRMSGWRALWYGSQSLCFQGVLLRWYTAGRTGILMSQSLCFQGVLLRGINYEDAQKIVVSIPLFSGRITAPEAAQARTWRKRLNPFVFRAYYCVVERFTLPVAWEVSIPLFSGRITAHEKRRTCRARKSQSLCFQGVLLREERFAHNSHVASLNPFVFRAYYCGKHLWLSA